MMQTQYTKPEFIALSTFLADWPEGMTYNKILENLGHDETGFGYRDDCIDVLCDFDGFPPNHIAQLIEDLHQTVDSVYEYQRINYAA